MTMINDTACSFDLPLIDTHTHFDVDSFDHDREIQSQLAWDNGVRHLVLIGFLAKYFAQMVACQQQMQGYEQQGKATPLAHLAFGLHPFYITEHKDSDLQRLEQFIQQYSPIAIGEIGLDTFTAPMKTAENYARQQDFFGQQLELAKQYQLPALLHIRRAHGDVIKMLKAQKFTQGGIAHSFSGGIQEAKALVNLGFKIGITGQVTNPNAKKLRHTLTELVKTVGLDAIVIETDCPDFTPLPCHGTHGRRNVPANLPYVLAALSDLLKKDQSRLAEQLWQNSCAALQVRWEYPIPNKLNIKPDQD
ncbi:TatD family deoxyribonuclease [Moraxella osloensis]|uniref:TatD family deoxyribonuclease n=1 Tax=Faucicola osloensis TaxID=34062 RepID=A0A6P1KFS3_FAUOS|nr:TatD family hydrolase [Moraxella osloensis]QHG08673.1 TatD family deoxyribonuclease [Moraxella osloensis]